MRLSDDEDDESAPLLQSSSFGLRFRGAKRAVPVPRTMATALTPAAATEMEMVPLLKKDDDALVDANGGADALQNHSSSALLLKKPSLSQSLTRQSSAARLVKQGSASILNRGMHLVGVQLEKYNDDWYSDPVLRNRINVYATKFRLLPRMTEALEKVRCSAASCRVATRRGVIACRGAHPITPCSCVLCVVWFGSFTATKCTSSRQR